MQHEQLDVYASHSQYEREKNWRKVFGQVVAALADIESLWPIAAISYDESTPNRKLNADRIFYRVDVENSTYKSLKGHPDLLQHWKNLVAGDESISPAIMARLARLCGPLYQSRGLAPHEYFKVIKKGRNDRRSKLPAEAAA